MESPLAASTLLCPQCDLLLAGVALAPAQRGLCSRCGAVLGRGTAVSRETLLAIAISAVPLWIVMNVFPLVAFTLSGERRESTLLGAAFALGHDGMPALGALVVLTAIVAPAAEIALALHIAGLHGCALTDRIGRAVKWYRRIKPWSMADVFLLGCMVSVVKLSHLAQLVVGPALWASALLLPALAFVTVHLEPSHLFRPRHDVRIA